MHTITLKTHYPGCKVAIGRQNNQWQFVISNRDPEKISNDEIRSCFETLLNQHFPKASRVVQSLTLDFQQESVCLESWRDIAQGRIQTLIDDQTEDFQHNKLGTFGYLMGQSKPSRLQFIDYAKKHPNLFEYIPTPKYRRNMTFGLSLPSYKQRFKYIIDLPGHTYSTKSYWMLFLKRPLFFVKPSMIFAWEKKLRPWVHYIPVKEDLSDLLQQFQWAEDHTKEIKEITHNLYQFAMAEMSPLQVEQRLIDSLSAVID